MKVRSLDELYAILHHYPRVIVLGPQRSGTNFAADILAEVTERPLFSERAFGETSCSIDPAVTKNESLYEFIHREQKYVLQAPTLTCQCHTLTVTNAILCYMDRPADEIEASRAKSDWPGTKRELAKYAKAHPYHFECMKDKPLGNLQRYVFDNFQRKIVQMPCIEMPFLLLSEHPRWYPPELRADFRIGQTRPEPN